MNQPKLTPAQEVEQCLTDLIRMTSAFDVNANGFVYEVKSGKLWTQKMENGVDAPICVYREQLPPATEPHFVFNPFQEHLECFVKTSNMFYSMWRTSLYGRVIQVIKLVIRSIQKSNGVKIDDDSTLSQVGTNHKELIKVGALNAENGKKLSSLIDEKSFDNISQFIESKEQKVNLIYIAYNKRMRSSSLKIDMITDDDYFDVNDAKKMRKQDIFALKAILMGIFGLKKKEDLEEFKETCEDVKTPGKLSTWLTVLFKAYQKLNPFLKIIDDLCDGNDWSIDLSALQHHITNLDKYAATTKWNTTGSGGHGAPVVEVMPRSAQPVQPIGGSRMYRNTPPVVQPTVNVPPVQHFKLVGDDGSQPYQPPAPTPVVQPVIPPVYPSVQSRFKLVGDNGPATGMTPVYGQMGQPSYQQGYQSQWPDYPQNNYGQPLSPPPMYPVGGVRPSYGVRSANPFR